MRERHRCTNRRYGCRIERVFTRAFFNFRICIQESTVCANLHADLHYSCISQVKRFRHQMDPFATESRPQLSAVAGEIRASGRRQDLQRISSLRFRHPARIGLSDCNRRAHSEQDSCSDDADVPCNHFHTTSFRCRGGNAAAARMSWISRMGLGYGRVTRLSIARAICSVVRI